VRSPGKATPGRSARTARGEVTFSQIQELASDLPGVEVSTSYGTPALKVRGKLFARQHQTENALVLRANALDRQILMQSDPATFYITDHYRDHPWVLVRLSAARLSDFPELLERAWRMVASKSLVSQLERGQ
jgi:hypothetical protein